MDFFKTENEYADLEIVVNFVDVLVDSLVMKGTVHEVVPSVLDD